MTTAKNNHGDWVIYPDDPTDKKGSPRAGILQCNYCGSITPEDFILAIDKGYTIGGSDWKYGWPHKFYVDWKNPNPDEKRIVSWHSVGGKVTDETWGTYPVLHLKFYSEHLNGWPELLKEDVQKKIEKATGILFIQEGDKLKYRAPYHGFQK